MKIKKKVIAMLGALLLTLITLFTCIPPFIAAADTEVTITIHYHRFDETYDGWNLWMWPKDGSGNAYYFSESDEFGQVATVSLSGAEAGIIVRLNEWEGKDVDADRFIDLTRAKDNQLHIYLVQSDPVVYYDLNEIDLSPKFLSASLPSNKEIEFTVTVPVDTSLADEAAYYKVIDEKGTEYPIMKIWSETVGNTSFASVILEERLDFGHSYTLMREGYGSIPISIGQAFSTNEFQEAYTYTGDDLGAVYTKESTAFRIYAPVASDVTLNLYSDGLSDSLIRSVNMAKDINGTWIHTETGDINGTYYTYSVTNAGITAEAVDPYAKAVGANGKRGMVIDLDSTDPSNWNKDKSPAFSNMTDAVIYELHVRDLSSDDSFDFKYPGKFLALTETGVKNSSGLSIGLDHLKELGITHLHLLPAFDYASVDETSDTAQFNWGYDPENYNVPEGSYSTDPYNGEVRIKEFKQMVQTLHDNGIRVVMDVVYNHTSATADSNFNKIVPDYYYRKDGSNFSNGSGCGNETASERSMVQKFIVDSVVYWATEYHVDGFRFDLMGLHDIETMNAVRAALDEIDESIIIYGEGWTAGGTPLSVDKQTLKANISRVSGVAAFSDDIRDAIKGSVFNAEEGGFVSGRSGLEESIKSGIVASTNHPQVDYGLVNYSDSYWANSPDQAVNYASAHDNLTLWDKLSSSNPGDSVEDRVKMNKLSAAIVLTSQGIPFFQAGEELLRTKPSAVTAGAFDENSYKSPDSVNSLRWDTKTDNINVFEYYKGLIAFRKSHASLRMTSSEDIAKNLIFADNLPENVIAYSITGGPNGETADGIYVIHNGNAETVTLDLPSGKWNVYVNGDKAGTEVLDTIKNGNVTVDGISTMVLVQGNSSMKGLFMGIGIAAALLAIAIGGYSMIKKKK